MPGWGSGAAFFLAVALDHTSVPVPLTAAAALGGTRGWSIHAVAVLALAAILFADPLLYLLGRYAGQAACLRWGGWLGLTEARLAQRGVWAVAFGRFLPGIGKPLPVVFGIAGAPPRSFLLGTLLGAVLTVGIFGYGVRWLRGGTETPVQAAVAP
jgi:membrane protein DedA with SNARE-associated domain